MRATLTSLARSLMLSLVAAVLVAGAATVGSAPAQADPGGILDYQWSLENRTSRSIELQMFAEDGGAKSAINYPTAGFAAWVNPGRTEPPRSWSRRPSRPSGPGYAVAGLSGFCCPAC
ncbi:MAG: hypothetical protein QOE52_4975 [Mycobacterium sp.]|jgi:hypothetical protein|nr:hypothetical protein [Mycobacterium sp.]MDT5254729.1 hypothetical protein [Mycobacterium sp.]MDT5345791.1 hypothetical protein [Mycobacterium sp.]